jgi:hypothetical protein
MKCPRAFAKPTCQIVMLRVKKSKKRKRVDVLSTILRNFAEIIEI